MLVYEEAVPQGATRRLGRGFSARSLQRDAGWSSALEILGSGSELDRPTALERRKANRIFWAHSGLRSPSASLIGPVHDNLCGARHCEERSDEAIREAEGKAGLLRYARNDAPDRTMQGRPRGSGACR